MITWASTTRCASSQVGLVGPQNYSRSVGWEPWRGLARYIGEVKRIQDSLSEAVFFGEVLGHAQIQLEGEQHCDVEYNVFRSLKTGKRVCILTNRGMEDRIQGIRSFTERRAGACGSTCRLLRPGMPRCRSK